MMNCTSKCMKVSEGMEDRISNLPSEIIDRILKYMSVRDAARTSILSRKWRDFWPMHSKLIFDEHTFRVISHGILLMPDNQIRKIINKILLQHMGPVVKFLLDLSYISSTQYRDVDQWMFFLSRNGVQKLTLLYSKPTAKNYRLPSYVFTCSSLEHLALHRVIIKSLSNIFLGNLTSLSFKNVQFELNLSKGYSYSLTTPQLKRLSIETCIGTQYVKIVAPSLEVLTIYSSGSKFNLLNPNLKELNFSFCQEVPSKHGSHFLPGILAYVPKIQILLFDGFILKFLAAGNTPPELPRITKCLEYLTLDDLDFKDLDQIASVIYLLRSCPNLSILDLKVSSRIITTEGERVLNYLNAPNCIKRNLIKLKTLRLYLYKDPVEELILLKLLLARSPSLDKVIIEERCHMDAIEGFRISRELLGFSRASPNANIIWNQCKTS